MREMDEWMDGDGCVDGSLPWIITPPYIAKGYAQLKALNQGLME